MKKINLSIFKSRRFKHGSMATAMTILFIVAVIIVNIIVNIILDRFPVSVDLTDSKIYELTQDSKDFVKDIDTDIKITVCYPEADMQNLTSGNQPYGKQALELLKNYQNINPNITVEYVDLLTNPEIESKYADYGVTTYSIIVESDKRTKVTSLQDFIEVSQSSTTSSYSYYSSAEQNLTSAIMYVSDDTISKTIVINGHSESDASSITSLLADNNYEVVEQNITTEDLDSEADLAIIVSPTTDYTDEELKKLDTFLDNNSKFGKNIIYIASYAQQDLPKLESFLAEWGIEVGNGVVAETDTKNIYDTYGFLFSADLLDETYTEGLRDSTLPVLVNRSVPLNVTFEEDGNRKTSVLMASKESSVILPLDENTENLQLDDLEKGVQNLAILGSRTKYDGTTALTSNVVVFGGIGMFISQYTADASLNNNDYAVNLINKLVGKEQNINISSVSFDAEKLQNLTLDKYNIIKFIFVVLVPLATLVMSVVVWVRRRNR